MFVANFGNTISADGFTSAFNYDLFLLFVISIDIACVYPALIEFTLYSVRGIIERPVRVEFLIKRNTIFSRHI